MAHASKNVADKGTIKAAYAKLLTARERVAKFNDDTNAGDKANVCDVLLGVLPTIREANPDDGKKIRRILRKLGHRISNDGYEVKFAKRSKPAKRTRTKAVANVDTNAEQVGASDVTADANATT